MGFIRDRRKEAARQSGQLLCSLAKWTLKKTKRHKRPSGIIAWPTAPTNGTASVSAPPAGLNIPAYLRGARQAELSPALVELGLTASVRSTQVNATRAKELAAKAIDNLADGAASADDQANRKGRLLKEPEEFREARVDRPKAGKR